MTPTKTEAAILHGLDLRGDRVRIALGLLHGGMDVGDIDDRLISELEFVVHDCAVRCADGNY